MRRFCEKTTRCELELFRWNTDASMITPKQHDAARQGLLQAGDGIFPGHVDWKHGQWRTLRLSVRCSWWATCNENFDQQKKVPLRAMLLSGPVNANHVANFCYNWGFNTVATNLPIFLNEVLEFDVRQNGLFSALPYAGLMVMRLIVATSFARCVRATGLGLTVVRKLNHTIGAVGAGACMLGLVALPSAYKVTAVLLVAASQTAAELSYTAGFLGSLLDLAPAHAGLLSGWTNAVGAATGLLAPGVVGALTRQGLRDEWNTVLYITAGFYLLGALVYLVFGSSELQPWAAPGAANSEPEAEPLLTADTTKAVPPQSSQSS